MDEEADRPRNRGGRPPALKALDVAKLPEIIGRCPRAALAELSIHRKEFDEMNSRALQAAATGGGRRRFVAFGCGLVMGPVAAKAAAVQADAAAQRPDQHEFTVYTFGDSVLDCAHYNAEGLDPGQLLVQNDDRLFPEFRGRDLRSRGPVRLVHRVVDGARGGRSRRAGAGCTRSRLRSLC